MNTTTELDKNRLEVYNTILLAVATLAVTWCSYQGTLWNGIQTFRLAESNKYSRLAQQTLIRSGQSMAMEEGVIIAFINAVFDKDNTKVDYILKGLRPELAGVLTNWLQSNPLERDSVSRNPMLMPEYEAIMEKRVDESTKMSGRADDAYKKAEKANTTADRYSLFSVMFSMVMFLGAITTKLVRVQLRFVLMVVSTIICIGSLILVLFQLPITLRG